MDILSVLSGAKWLHKFGCHWKIFYHNLSCMLYGFLRILPIVNYCACVPHCRLFLSSSQYNRDFYSNLSTFCFFVVLYMFLIFGYYRKKNSCHSRILTAWERYIDNEMQTFPTVFSTVFNRDYTGNLRKRSQCFDNNLRKIRRKFDTGALPPRPILGHIKMIIALWILFRR